MNTFFFAAFLSLGVLVSGYGHDDGQWRGEGLAESQDYGQHNQIYSVPIAYASAYAHQPAPLGHDGRVVDTPEVAHAKAAHFAAKSAALSHAGQVVSSYIPIVSSYAPVAYTSSYAHQPAPLGHDGRVVDTPEVAHAKAAHFAAKSAALSHASSAIITPVVSSYAPIVSAYAHQPAPLGPDGRVVDTAEVAHAKAAHLAAKSAALSHASVYAPVAAYSSGYAHQPAPIGHDGRVVDTPEVAHAKAAHFAAKAAASHGTYGHY